MQGEVVPIQQVVDISKPHWRCKCGTVAMPLTDDTYCLCPDYYEQEWTRIDPTLLPEEHR